MRNVTAQHGPQQGEPQHPTSPPGSLRSSGRRDERSPTRRRRRGKFPPLCVYRSLRALARRDTRRNVDGHRTLTFSARGPFGP